MKNSNNSRIGFKDIALWTGVIFVTIAAFLGTYYFNLSDPIKVIVWIVWLIVAGLLGFFTSKGKEVFEFAKDAKTELQKVVWPSRQETIQTTSIVMIMVAVTGFILWGVDTGMMWAIAKLTHLG